MMTPSVYYCYDAYCGWCYGFSPVIKKLADEFQDKVDFEALSGGMIPIELARPISYTAGYIRKAYKQVELTTGVKFGEDFLWHIHNPDLSDWIPSSEKPAIALCVFKEFHPDRSIHFAADLQYALHFEGRDLTDDEAYRHLLMKYGMSAEEFYRKMQSPEYKQKAYEEFAIVKQLQISGFPSVLVQATESKFYLIARGYTPFEPLRDALKQVLASVVE